MNERIRELAEQAEERARVITKSDMGYMGFEIDEDAFRKKFAELIIRECCQFNYDFLESYREACEVNGKIKEHFGVER